MSVYEILFSPKLLTGRNRYLIILRQMRFCDRPLLGLLGNKEFIVTSNWAFLESSASIYNVRTDNSIWLYVKPVISKGIAWHIPRIHIRQELLLHTAIVIKDFSINQVPFHISW